MRVPEDDGSDRERRRSIRNLKKIERLTGTTFDGFSQPDASMAAMEAIADIVQLWLKITSEVERAEILQRMRAAAAKCAAVHNP